MPITSEQAANRAALGIDLFDILGFASQFGLHLNEDELEQSKDDLTSEEYSEVSEYGTAKSEVTDVTSEEDVSEEILQVEDVVEVTGEKKVLECVSLEEPVLELVFPEIIGKIERGVNPISIVNECAHKDHSIRLIEHDNAESGLFRCDAYKDDEFQVKGIGVSKKEAKKEVAVAFLNILKDEKRVVSAVELENEDKPPDKVYCNRCDFMVNPSGHNERCEIEGSSVRKKDTEFLYNKYKGDLIHKIDLCEILQKYKIVEQTRKSVEQLISTFINQTAQSDYYKKRFEISALFSEHKVADFFEAKYYNDTSFRSEYLKYIEATIIKNQKVS